MGKVRYRHVIDLDEREEELLQRASQQYGGIKKAIMHGLMLITKTEKKTSHVKAYQMGREALEKPATEKQINYIRDLIADLRGKASEEGQILLDQIEEILQKISKDDASKLIKALEKRDREYIEKLLEKYK